VDYLLDSDRWTSLYAARRQVIACETVSKEMVAKTIAAREADAGFGGRQARK